MYICYICMFQYCVPHDDHGSFMRVLNSGNRFDVSNHLGGRVFDIPLECLEYSWMERSSSWYINDIYFLDL